jgi:ABC-type branched-subunit amino acid transport system substrate-binding protein
MQLEDFQKPSALTMKEDTMIDARLMTISSRTRRKRLFISVGIFLLGVAVTALIVWRNQITAATAAAATLIVAAFVFNGIGRAVIGDIYTKGKNWFTRSNPYIAVVASKKSTDFPIPEEFLRGFDEAFPGGRTYVETREGKKVDFRIKEDLGSAEEAARIATELVADKECVLVIGNSNSTLTDVTLDIFLRSNDPPSYILPIATANEIMTKAKTGGHGAVLRMVPDNARQAEVIQNLVKEIVPEPRVAIYGDQENSFYSLNLSRDIASRIRSGGGHILIEEMIGPTNSIYSSIAAWRSKQPPNVIVFVGVAHHSLLLIDQCRDLGIDAPIIFTDGCMVGSLLTNISKLSNRAFVLSPVGTHRLNEQIPTYEPVGKDAYGLASRIVNGCSDCTRSGLRKYVTEQKQAIQLLNGYAGEYRFDADGNNNSMTYKVYEITCGKVKRVAGY